MAIAADRAGLEELWGDSFEPECERRVYAVDSDRAVQGDAAGWAEGAQRWAEGGATAIVFQPTVDEPSPEQFVRFVAEEVRPMFA
ncbi:MAG TPA: hypothetical protein VME20_11385 [Acidimicrobiales bacterium]|nr:hypothetical protein [Acidimicrobiales bacterium]